MWTGQLNNHNKPNPTEFPDAGAVEFPTNNNHKGSAKWVFDMRSNIRILRKPAIPKS